MTLFVRATIAGLALLAAEAPLLAQSNPFVPEPKVNPADLDKAIDARLKKLQPKTGEQNGAAPGSPLAPGVPAGQIAPYGPPGAGAMPGAPGAPGMAGAAMLPTGPVQAALAAGARFVGCLNNKHYFAAKGGIQLTFKPAEIKSAVREGAIPACR